jgi:glycine cleavage system H protein
MKFTEDHEWLRAEGDDLIVVGITEHAAKGTGRHRFRRAARDRGHGRRMGDEVVVIESVKAASDILAPVDGEIVEVNSKLSENPGLVNADPLGAGWFFKVKVDDMSVLDDFMDEDEYQDHIA